MASNDERLAHLIELFSQLSGIGPKSAGRIVNDLLLVRPELARELAGELLQCTETAHHCPHCNTLTTLPLCAVCADKERDSTVLCVVETPADEEAIESSVSYRGRYFVLMGRINPMQGVGPKDIGVDRLVTLVREDGVREVVIATSYTAEGETTAHMLTAALRKYVPEVRVTRLARGVPAGVEIEYTDPASIAAAMIDRR